MTDDQDGTFPPDDVEGGRPDATNGGDRKLDEDAAWRAIVENYGDRPVLGPEPAPDPAEPTEPPAVRPSLFQPSWSDPLETEATWEDEGHFVPPVPPPMPPVEPRRKLAWIGLFGAPLVGLLAVVLGLHLPLWFGGMATAAFLGGFGYLVATMPRTRGGGDGSGDDGAVV